MTTRYKRVNPWRDARRVHRYAKHMQWKRYFRAFPLIFSPGAKGQSNA